MARIGSARTAAAWRSETLNQPEKLRFTRRIGSCVLQASVALFGLLVFLSYLYCVPEYYERLVSTCALQDCGRVAPAPPTTEALLRDGGLTVSSYALWFVGIDCAFTLPFACSAFLIALKGRREPMALLGALMLVSFGTTFPLLVHTASYGDPLRTIWFDAVSAIGWISLFLFFCLFPNGRFSPGWISLPLAFFSLAKIASAAFPNTALDSNYWPLPAVVALFGLPIASLVYSQIYRYRRTLTPEQRQQSKWIVFGFSVGSTSFLGISLLFQPSWYSSPSAFIYLNGLLHLFLLPIPLSLVFALLRRRLWDVDPVVSRTLVYLLLSACIAALYGFSIVFFGKLLHTADRFVPSLIAAAVIALLFAPIKEHLSKRVNRLFKGRHDDPIGMLSELRGLLTRPLPPEEMLRTLVRFIRRSLRIPYAAIAVEVNGASRIVSSDPGISPAADSRSFPIVHRGEEAGILIAAARSGETFTPADLRLLDVLLGHAGPVVENFSMTRGMKLLADDLQRSREKLVIAREEERRAIRRNLHDELAPRLAALGLNATAAEMNVRRDPEAAVELLANLRLAIRSTVEDIRTLVHDMRPASLDEWGLAGAIRQRIKELARPMELAGDGQGLPGLTIDFHEPPQLPELPAAVEVAVYWIASEAIANVVRHSGADDCQVKLEVAPGERVILEVSDNGIGSRERWSSSGRGGIGLASMRERAAELGGRCSIYRSPSGGTRVTASIPLPIGKEPPP